MNNDEILFFASIQEYEARPGFVGPIDVLPGQLDKIIGKYELPASKALWARCGLNQCNEPHRRGYIIKTKEGLETNCGNLCGRREFGVEFEEVEARYKRAEDAAARKRVIADMLAQKSDLTAVAQRLLPLAIMQSDGMARFNQAFHGCTSFFNQLLKCAKQGGAIRAAIRRDKDWNFNIGRHEQLETVGRIAGYKVLLNDGTPLHKAVAERLLPWLQETLNNETLDKLDEAGLKSVIHDATVMRDLIRRTEEFVSNSAGFLAPENAAQFELVRIHLLSRGVEKDDLREVIQLWSASARQSLGG